MEESDQTLLGGGGGGSGGGKGSVQNVVVMRHGDRIDAVEPLWVTHADRPWDPPLTEPGKIRAWTTGKKLRGLDFPIHRVVVSPFIRCLQTAFEAISALCAIVDDDSLLLAMETSENAVIDPSRVKVSIEYGLCEVLCRQAISIDLVPKDGNWFPDVLELEAKLPAGTLDHSVERVYRELPRWEESISDARNRYHTVIQALADKFPHENLLLVTHGPLTANISASIHMPGEGVGVAVSSFSKDVEVYEVDYCAYSHLQRHISFLPSEGFIPGNFNMLTKNGQTGIRYFPPK